MDQEPLIVSVIHRFHPDWKPPRDNHRDWIACLCPFHGERNSSASVSYTLNGFKCHGCGYKADAIAILMKEGGMTFAEAQRIAETGAVGSGGAVRPEPARKPSRRVFGQSGSTTSGGGQVRPGVRGRSTPWS
ncbi:CHC2 zinc finger domain-containing protein [Nocardia sp. NPDC001965]